MYHCANLMSRICVVGRVGRRFLWYVCVRCVCGVVCVYAVCVRAVCVCVWYVCLCACACACVCACVCSVCVRCVRVQCVCVCGVRVLVRACVRVVSHFWGVGSVVFVFKFACR